MSISTFIEDIAKNTMEEMPLMDFTRVLHERFYSEVNIEFMEEFFEYARQENEKKFIISHEVLIKYGVATSNRSNDISKRLTKLGLVEKEHYTLRHVSQRNSNGRGATIKNIYMLTPQALFLALMRAQRRPDQTIDPIIYADYFMFIQKVMLYYNDYQKQLQHNKDQIELKEKEDKIDKLEMEKKNDKIALNEKDDKIDRLEQTVNKLLQATNKSNDKLDVAIDKIDEANKQLNDANGKLDNMENTMNDIHQVAVESAYHSTAIVPDGKQTHFALTSKIDETGKITFKTYRTQKTRMFKELTKALAENKHQLVIPPMYIAGPVNIPIAAMLIIKNRFIEIAEEHNADDSNEDTWYMTNLIKNSGLKLNNVNSVWVPNEFITKEEMINSYLNVITNSQGRPFQMMDMPDKFIEVVEKRKQDYEERIAKSTGEYRQMLEEMAQLIENAHNATH